MSDTRYIVYTTHCPKCNVLEIKLKKASVAYDVTDDIQPVIDAGFMSAPVLYDKIEEIVSSKENIELKYTIYVDTEVLFL